MDDSTIKTFNRVNIDGFKKKINAMSACQLAELKEFLDNRYYNTGEETISDDKYDLLVGLINSPTHTVGCKLRDGDNATKLPFNLNSMDKIKQGDTKKLDKFVSKFDAENGFIISDKLNGVSCLVCYGKTPDDIRLYTRGDGLVGADISYFKDKIKGVISGPVNVNIRGELIITKHDFDVNYKADYKNSLAMLVSVVNSKTLKEAINHVQFVAYEVVTDKPAGKPSENMRRLSKLGFKTVNNVIAKSPVDSFLYKHLQERYEESEFSIDGIIIQVDAPYNRTSISASGNPDYAVAYKMITDSCETVVQDVLWAPSRYSILKPRIQIEPVELCGVTIKFVTGSNAKFINDNKINKGSRVVVIRAGEIIPKIEKVISTCNEGKMPSTPYFWNETGVDIISKDTDDDLSITVRRLAFFFSTLGVEQFAEGTIKKIVLAGYDDIFKILNMTEQDFLKIQTFEKKMSQKLRLCLDDLCSSKYDIETLMAASGLFGQGIGVKKLKTLVSAIPTILEKTPATSEISKIKGFSDKTSEKILSGLDSFREFYNKFSQYNTSVNIKEEISYDDSLFTAEEIEQAKLASGTSSRLNGEIVVFTNFRDGNIETSLRNAGAEIGDSVTKKTTCLVVPDGNTSTSGKIAKAVQYKIKVLEKSQFVREYGL